MARIVEQANVDALGWEKVICARLLGVAHTTLEAWRLETKPQVAPNVLIGALCLLPPAVVVAHLAKDAWPQIKRPALVPPSPLVWQWRARLCQLAAEHGVS
jgi:hypothetical protein